MKTVVIADQWLEALSTTLTAIGFVLIVGEECGEIFDAGSMDEVAYIN